MLNKNGKTIDTLLSGETVRIEIQIEKKNFTKPLEIGIGFYNSEDAPQFHCSTKTINKSYVSEDEFLTAILEIEKWPIAQGTFYLNAYVRDELKLLDHVVESIWLNCEKGDFYGTGILPSWNKGFYCDYDWK